MGSVLLLAAVLASTAPASDPVLAVFAGGEVRESEVRREESFLRPDERRFRERMGLTPRATWRDWTKRAALRRIALSRRAQEPWGRDEARRDLAHRTARDWWLARWAQDCYGLPLEVPTDAELRAGLTVPDLPERLRLSHIFLRASGDDEHREAVRQLQAWIERAAGIEAFRELARRHSQSESAARGGKLGVMRRGWLPREAEEALARVEVGRISPPLALRGGVHIFYVEERLAAGPAPIEPRLARSREEAAAAARRRCRASRLATSLASGQAGESDEEVLYREALRGGHVPPDARLRLDDIEADVWLRGWLEDQARARLVAPTETELRQRFADKPARTQARLAVRCLTVDLPQATDPLAAWDALAASARDLRSGEQTWEEASAAIAGSRLESLPLTDAIDLADRLGPRALEGVKGLPAGAVAGPFREGPEARVVGVLEVEPSRARTFDEQRQALTASLVRERQRAALEAVTGEVLSAAAFRLTPEGQRTLERLPDTVSAEAVP